MANAGAIGGGALGGAGTGAAVGSVVPGIGTAVGAVGGAIIGGLSGLFSSNSEEAKEKQQMLLRAADQRAAPWLAKLGEKVDVTPYDLGTNHGTDVLQGALSGFQQYQAGQQAAQKNNLNEALLAKLQGPNTGSQQAQALQAMGGIAGGGASNYDDIIKAVQANPSLLSQLSAGGSVA